MTGLPNNKPGTAPVKSPRKGRYDATRVTNFKRLIEMLRKQNMNRAQASEALGISVQNASKYFCDLGKQGVTICGADPDALRSGRRISHSLTENGEAIDAFLATLDLPRRAMPKKVRASEDPTRHLHLIFAGVMGHTEQAAPAPDPLALPKAFFRPVRLDDEPLPRAPAVQVTRSSFPMPDSAAFVVPT